MIVGKSWFVHFNLDSAASSTNLNMRFLLLKYQARQAGWSRFVNLHWIAARLSSRMVR